MNERVGKLVLRPVPPNFAIPEDFKPFDWRGDFWNYERNLPYWRQPGVTYFITFRLNDSLPREVVEAAKREKQAWNERLARQPQPDELLPEDYAAWQRRTWRKMESVMDQCHGSSLLRQPSIRRIVTDALLFFENERSTLHGFVLMPNHVHLAARALGDWQIEDVLKSWKGFTSREINKLTGQKGQLWQEDNWNRVIQRRRFTRQSPEIIAGALKLDLLHHEATLADAALKLTPTEFALLKVLAEHAARIVTQNQIMKQVWAGQSSDLSEGLRVHINHLRKKLGESGPRIVNEPGIGYRLEA